MDRSLRYLIFCNLLVTILSCEKSQEVSIRVFAQDNSGNPVNGATITLNQDHIGETNSDGQFELSVMVKTSEKMRFEVSKQSENLYYAPYFQTYNLKEAEDVNAVDIEAILYSVPKSSEKNDVAKKSTLEFDSNTIANKNPQEITTPEKVAPVPPHLLPQSLPNKTLESAKKKSETLEEKDYSNDKQDPLSKQIDQHSLASESKNLPESPASIQETVEQLVGPGLILGSSKSIEYPKKSKKKAKGKKIYTILVKHDNKPVPFVEVSWGTPQNQDLQKICTTNKRGRCAIRFGNKLERSRVFVLKKKGYQTRSIKTKIKNKGILNVNLHEGMTIDIYAVTRKFQFTRGLGEVEVSIDGQKVGSTDRFGHFSYFYKGEKDDLIEITLHSKNYLPSVFRTDFITSGDLSLVRHFSPKNAPKARLAITDTLVAGAADFKNTSLTQINDSIEKYIKNHIFLHPAFKEYSKQSFKKYIDRNGMKLSKVKTRGWQGYTLKGHLDAILVPTLIHGSQSLGLEIQVIGSRGKIMASAEANLSDEQDHIAISNAIKDISQKLRRIFPFEGSILKRSPENALINLGKNNRVSLQAGEKVLIYGLNVSERGEEQKFDVVAEGLLTKILNNTSEVKISYQKPRSIISRGDVVVLNRSPQRSVSLKDTRNISYRTISVVSKENKKVLTNANIYFKGHWIGTTDHMGKLQYTIGQMRVPGILKVIKHGYAPYVEKIKTIVKNKKIGLIQQSGFIRVQSEPSGADTYIENKFLGKTPLSAPVSVPSGFVKMELKGIPGYKTKELVLELDDGTLELVGARKILLEKDIVAQAQKLVSTGELDRAINLLIEIEDIHSDFLIAKHQLGEIYLSMQEDPIRAAEAFGKVTQSPAVASFQDKRFIGSHINEGLALFMAAENLIEQSQELATAHYDKAIATFDKVEPFLRFVPKEQYDVARKNLLFHRALSYHKIWSLTANTALLQKAYQDWERYIDHDAGNDSEFAEYRKHADVYYKQAQSILNSSTPKTKL